MNVVSLASRLILKKHLLSWGKLGRKHKVLKVSLSREIYALDHLLLGSVTCSVLMSHPGSQPTLLPGECLAGGQLF